ncbi:MAG: glycosyltransferase [Bacteroidota bacterium]|jgi:cellulose synthase/poly-beta-1,6-N-acetylglucosamine synthase-like glycosyltransferase
MEILIIIRWFLILAAAFYLAVHLGLTIGLKRCKQTKSPLQPFISVIVAARNEERTIGLLLDCLSQQTYTHYEIIIVDDRSTDSTATIIADFQKKNPAIKRIDIAIVPSDMPAKKNALRAGIKASKGEILCFTDADCFPPPTWLKELVQQFEPEVGLVAGYSPYTIPSNKTITNGILRKIFFKFIAYEEFRAAIWSCGAIGWNLGWLCTGRNLAYRRKLYDEVNGFEKIKQSISGDDDLFLQLVRRQTDWEIRYMKTKESFVPTVPPADFRSFVEQRKRHFSASKVFTFPMMLFFFFYHFANFLLFFSTFLFLLHLISIPIVLACIGTKLFADTILVFFSAGTFDASTYCRSLIIMEVFYILYNSLIGPLGILKKFEWKQS